MKRLMFLTILPILILTSCKQAPPLTPNAVNEPELVPYLEAYLESRDEHLGLLPSLYNIHVVFVDGFKEDNVIAMCTTYTYSFYRKIEIDKSQWEMFSEVDRKWIFWHEALHCNENMSHYERDLDIMNARFSPNKVSEEDFKSYEIKAFSRI